MNLTIGCQTRPYGKLLSFAEMCQHLAAAGYTDAGVGHGLVSSESTEAEVRAARDAASQAGISPSLVVVSSKVALGLKAALDDYRRLIDHAALLGARWLLELGTERTELLADYIQLMRQACPYAQQAGIGITMKPHGGITLTVQDLVSIHRRVGHAAFGISYDPGNIIYYTKGDLRPETEVGKVAPLVTTAIIKDCRIVDSKPDVMITPGEGLVDFKVVLSGLVQGGFRGPLYVECVGGASVGEIDANLKRTLSFVRAIVSAL